MIDLSRFIHAQNNCYSQILKEIRNGNKESHWMWFTFPQIAGLGRSRTAKKYEISNIEEAENYLLNDVLSERLIELTRILTYEVGGKTAEEIFGFPDYLKFHSSMTLFYLVVTKNTIQINFDYSCFEDALKKYYQGKLDILTVEILNKKDLL
jgi:hypothetical protein